MMITQIQKQLTLQAAVIRMAGDMYGNNLKALQTVAWSLAGIPAAQMRALNAAVSVDVAEAAETQVKTAKPALAVRKKAPVKRPDPARPKPALKAKPAPVQVVKAKTKPVVMRQVVADSPKVLAAKSPKSAPARVNSVAVKAPAQPAPSKPSVPPAARRPRAPSHPASLPGKNSPPKD